MQIYGRVGVSHLRLLDPLARTREVYRYGNQRWAPVATYAGDDAVRGEPFEALALTMHRWWLEG